MKKINYKKILIVVLWIIGLSGLFSSLAFAVKLEKKTVAENLSIKIINTEENSFIDEQDIMLYFKEQNDSILFNTAENIDVNKIEKILNAHPAIENADAAIDINGDITITIKQRTPIVRILNTYGDSYYIDKQARLMPLNDKYSARVLVATGYIADTYVSMYQYSINQILGFENLKNASVIDDIFLIADYIQQDTLLNNLIHQININKEKEIELFPAIGNHKILFGEAIDIEEKFKKLKLFYKEGLTKTDSWNKYSAINIKYKNQVVCTKK